MARTCCRPCVTSAHSGVGGGRGAGAREQAAGSVVGAGRADARPFPPHPQTYPPVLCVAGGAAWDAGGPCAGRPGCGGRGRGESWSRHPTAPTTPDPLFSQAAPAGRTARPLPWLTATTSSATVPGPRRGEGDEWAGGGGRWVRRAPGPTTSTASSPDLPVGAKRDRLRRRGVVPGRVGLAGLRVWRGVRPRGGWVQ